MASFNSHEFLIKNFYSLWIALLNMQSGVGYNRPFFPGFIKSYNSHFSSIAYIQRAGIQEDGGSWNTTLSKVTAFCILFLNILHIKDKILFVGPPKWFQTVYLPAMRYRTTFNFFITIYFYCENIPNFAILPLSSSKSKWFFLLS